MIPSERGASVSGAVVGLYEDLILTAASEGASISPPHTRGVSWEHQGCWKAREWEMVRFLQHLQIPRDSL